MNVSQALIVKIEHKTMKKTLTTLLAVAGFASGATLSLNDALYTATDGESITASTSGESAISGSFSVTMTLNANAMIGVLGDDQADRPTLFYVDVTGSGMYITLATALKNTGFVGMAVEGLNSHPSDGASGESRQPFTSNGSTPATNAFADANAANNLNSKLGDITDIALTLSHYDKNSSSLYVTINFADGTSSELYGTATGLKWSAGIGSVESVNVNSSYVESTYLFAGTVDQETAFALNKEAIPEPTTASLSLLGLAALMIRRRRA